MFLDVVADPIVIGAMVTLRYWPVVLLVVAVVIVTAILIRKMKRRK